MMQRINRYVFSIAGIIIKINTDRCLEMEDAFENFQTENQRAEVTVKFREIDKLPEPLGKVLRHSKYYKIYKDEKDKEICVFFDEARGLEPYAVRTLKDQGKLVQIDYLKKGTRCVSELRNSFAHIDFESIMLTHGRLCFHASCVDTCFGGILFTGESGVGKSTQAELWGQYRAVVQINGDRPILSCEQNGWKAWGSPYAGSSKYHVNKSCMIGVIVRIKQGKECSIKKLKGMDSFKAVWQGITVHSWNRDFIDQVSNLVMDLVCKVPVLELTCTPDLRAVECLEQELQKRMK